MNKRMGSGTALLRAHLDELDRRGLTEGTITRRRLAIERLIEHLHPGHILDATSDDIEHFLDIRDIGVRTRYHWLSNFHCFYDWAIRTEVGTSDPTAAILRPKLPRLLPRPIADDDLERAITEANPVMECWLLLAAYAGLRCAEIARLQATDLLLGDKLLLVRGKGNKERLVPMHPRIIAALRNRHMPRSGPVFRRARGSAFPAAMVSREISVYFDGLGIEATAHSLRHWFGSRTYQASNDLRAVQELLGHSNSSTTAIYTAWSPTAARAAVESI